MTRINLVHPTQLTDKHLMAEYRELPRIFTLVKKAHSQGKTPNDFQIADNYILGKGHVTFFYNKINWLMTRYKGIAYELKQRGFNLDEDQFCSIYHDAMLIPQLYFSLWKPRPEDIYLNMARLAKRSKIDLVLEELNNE